MKRMNSQEWIRQMAAKEDNATLSAGGLAADAGMLGGRRDEATEGFSTHRIALARYIEFSRRRLHLSVEAFAAQAGIRPSEALQLEDEDAAAPEPPVIFAVAAFLHADAAKLMELAGHVRPRDSKLGEEAMRFAALSQPSRPLSSEEERVLEHFSRAVHE